MRYDYVFILAAFNWAYPSCEGGNITGQQRLIETLPKVTKANEFSFESKGHLFHRYSIEDQKRDAIYEFDWTYLDRVPMVAFLNLSLSAHHIIEEIQDIRRGFPFAIFILYGNDSEYQKFFSELGDEDVAWFRRFYRLRKDDGNTDFATAVRNILDQAVATAVNKIENSTLFSVFISYSHMDKTFAKWLDDELRRAGIRCWLDEKQIRAGERIHTKIEEGIYERNKILLCASKHSLTSWWVDNEINSVISKEQRLWKEHGKETLSLIPINLDGFMFSEEWRNAWKNQITSRLALDFTDWSPDHYYDGVGIQKLLDVLIVDKTKKNRPFD